MGMNYFHESLDFKVRVEKKVYDHIFSYRQTSVKSQEAGGQLFAVIDGASIILKLATGPHQKDIRTLFGFLPNRENEQKIINKQYSKGLHYVGDWHTHYEENPSPSFEDLNSMQESFLLSKHDLNWLILIIIGKTKKNNFYIAVINNSDVFNLRRES
jgi:integrative and conjugative element protein (TIGR02256 family)